MTRTLVDFAETDALLCRLRAGDRGAFERLLERHEPAVRGVVGRRLSPRLRSRIDDSDIIQETRQYAFTHLDDYLERRPMPFRLWLLKTAHQRLRDIERDHLATAKRSARREVPLPDQSSIDLVGALVGRSPSPAKKRPGASWRRRFDSAWLNCRRPTARSCFFATSTDCPTPKRPRYWNSIRRRQKRDVPERYCGYGHCWSKRGLRRHRYEHAPGEPSSWG